MNKKIDKLRCIQKKIRWQRLWQDCMFMLFKKLLKQSGIFSLERCIARSQWKITLIRDPLRILWKWVMPLFKSLPIQTRVHRQATLAWPGNPQECRITDPISHTFNCFVFFLMCLLVGSSEELAEVFPSREAVTTSSIAKMQSLGFMLRLAGFKFQGL